MNLRWTHLYIGFVFFSELPFLDCNFSNNIAFCRDSRSLKSLWSVKMRALVFSHGVHLKGKASLFLRPAELCLCCQAKAPTLQLY